VNQWLTRCSLRKPSSATAVRTGVTVIVTKSQRFTSPSSKDSYRTEKKGDSCLSLGLRYATSDEIAPDALCVLCKKVLPNSAVVPAKLLRNCDTIALSIRKKILDFQARA
jgi:hypothetical protein